MTAEQTALAAPAPRVCWCKHCREFREFNVENPQVYAELVRILKRAKSFMKSWGIGAAVEVYRWERGDTKHDPEGYKINHNHRSRYARLILIREPELRGFLKLRELKTFGCIADELFEAIVGPITDEEGGE